MNNQAQQWFEINNIQSVSLIDDDVIFDLCDASREYGDCWECECMDSDGNVFQASLIKHVVCEFVNGVD
jgi:hypothetical protein